MARGWQEFIIHNIFPMANKSEITTARAVLIHSIIKGDDIRVEKLIANNIILITQGLSKKGKLGFPSTIYKLCKDAKQNQPRNEDEDQEMSQHMSENEAGFGDWQHEQQHHQFKQPLQFEQPPQQ
ncbi:hypothetical protein PIB30_084541 [Stylosanthes scabra]|uniref:Putative plant transposon protein domain-containing protein n=1 Tax=Stylosanthes scabra TaxID=79078 RepID=A0ABU6ZRC0_9FABA|nr:hypothetical protein [Stylosanthes scabra]